MPEPVPPEMMTLQRPLTQALRKSRTWGLIVPNAIRSRSVNGSAANLRMVSIAPSSAIGGITALTRLPSGRRASTSGLASSTRRPTRPTILSMVRRRWASSAEVRVDRVELAVALDVDRVGAVDHDLGDLAVAQQRLQRAVAEDLVGDLLGDPRPVGERQRRFLGVDHVLEGLTDLGLELVLVQVRVVAAGDPGSRAAPGGRSPSPWQRGPGREPWRWAGPGWRRSAPGPAGCVGRSRGGLPSSFLASPR